MKLVVLKEANESDWGAPSFAQHKAKTNRAILLSNFQNLNKQLKRKPCPMPKMCEMLLNLEGFKYDLSVYLNMSYYHICLSKQASNLCTIILLWVKYRHKRLTMGLSNSPDILQEKINKMFHSFKFIQAYIDDLLIITKGDFSNHLEKQEQIFQKLKENGLKFNIEKSSFGKTEMEYLGFWVTRTGI